MHRTEDYAPADNVALTENDSKPGEIGLNRRQHKKEPFGPFNLKM